MTSDPTPPARAPEPECRLWVLLLPGAPLTAAAAAEKLTGVAGRLAPLWKPPPGFPAAWSDPVQQTHTAELRLPAHLLDGSAALDAALADFPARPDVRVIRVTMAGGPPAPADASSPRVRVGAWHLAQLPAGPAAARHWHLWGGDPSSAEETLRRLHRAAVAEQLHARHRLEAEAYATEIGNDLQFIERAINKVLRFRLEGQDRPALIAQLEQNVKDLSSNYAKLNRNAGVYRDVVLEEERLVLLHRRTVDELGPSAPEGGTEAIFCRLLDRADEGLEGSRRRERELLACLQSAQTAIAMHGMNIELLRSGELVELQKHTGEMLNKGVELQNAAEVIEFVVLFTYSLHAWEMILGPDAFHAIPWYARLLAPLTFSGCLVATAHPFIEWKKHRHFPKWARWTLAGALLALAAMFLTPALCGTAHHGEGAHAPPPANSAGEGSEAKGGGH